MKFHVYRTHYDRHSRDKGQTRKVSVDSETGQIGDSKMATVEKDEFGNLVLNDPEAVEVATVVAKHNCLSTLKMQSDRVAYFRQRADDRGDSAEDVVIVLANVDDRQGGLLADVLMPEHNWQQYRDRDEIPFARGLAGREVVQSFLDVVDSQAAEKLRAFDSLAVVVVDHGVAEVF